MPLLFGHAALCRVCGLLVGTCEVEDCRATDDHETAEQSYWCFTCGQVAVSEELP